MDAVICGFVYPCKCKYEKVFEFHFIMHGVIPVALFLLSQKIFNELLLQVFSIENMSVIRL